MVVDHILSNHVRLLNTHMAKVRIVVLLLLGLASAAKAQTWTTIGNKLFVKHIDNGGALCYSHGVIWAGYDVLMYSKDMGVTWTKCNLPTMSTRIHDIAFGDPRHGYCLRNSLLYRTSDGGSTWSVAITLSGAQALACSPDGSLVYLATSYGVFARSADYGVTWSTTAVLTADDKFLGDVFYSPNGTLYIVAGFRTATTLWSSVDGGTVWNSSNAGQGDSWSGAIDSCSGQIYVANEDYWAHHSRTSNVYATSNAGANWRTALTIDTPGLSGSIAVGGGAVAAQTLKKGVYYSEDKAATWKSIGGPNQGQDSRSLVVLGDHSIFAGSVEGDVWFYQSTSTAVPLNLFSKDTLGICLDSSMQYLLYKRQACTRNLIDIQIAGTDSAAYFYNRSTSPDADSIAVYFRPLHEGINSAELILTFDDGSQSRCALLGVGYGVIVAKPTLLPTVAATAIGEDVIMPIDLTFNQPVANIGFTLVYDTSVLVYSGTWLAEGTQLDKGALLNSGRVPLQLPFGYIGDHIVAQAHFRIFPRYDSLTNIQVKDITWTARTGMCLSILDTDFTTSLTFPTTCGDRFLSDYLRYGVGPTFSIRPNPAVSEIVVSVRNVEGYEVSIVDVTGRVMIDRTFVKPGDQTIDIGNLPQGTYFVNARSDRWSRSLAIEKQ
jgi:photosystem II stability/assembly factor-like uncharacterized protein